MTPKRLIRAIASPNGFDLRYFDGDFFKSDGATMFYVGSEISTMASAKWVRYSTKYTATMTVFQADIKEYTMALAKCEWTAFCTARDVADQVHWGRGVTFDGITQATKETRLNPIRTPD